MLSLGLLCIGFDRIVCQTLWRRHVSEDGFMANAFVEGSSRRKFLKAATAAGLGLSQSHEFGFAQVAGERPNQAAALTVVNPRARVPVSFIIDDSTCLVNLAHYAMPQFSEAWPGREDYKKPWWTWPREIPDSFVRKFGEW